MRSGLPSRFSHQGPAMLSAQHQQQPPGEVPPAVSNARLKVINDGFNEMDQAQLAHFAHKTGIELGIAAVLDRKLPPGEREAGITASGQYHTSGAGGEHGAVDKTLRDAVRDMECLYMINYGRPLDEYQGVTASSPLRYVISLMHQAKSESRELSALLTAASSVPDLPHISDALRASNNRLNLTLLREEEDRRDCIDAVGLHHTMGLCPRESAGRLIDAFRLHCPAVVWSACTYPVSSRDEGVPSTMFNPDGALPLEVARERRCPPVVVKLALDLATGAFKPPFYTYQQYEQEVEESLEALLQYGATTATEPSRRVQMCFLPPGTPYPSPLRLALQRHFQANPVRAIEYLGYAIFRKDEASMAYEGAAMVKQRLAAQPMDVEVPAEEQAESSAAASLRTLPSPPPQPFSASEEIAIAEMLQQPLPLAAHNNDHWNRLQATAYLHTGPGQPNRYPTSSFHSSAAGPSAPPVPVSRPSETLSQLT